MGESPQLGKKMIKPDPDLVSSLLNFSDEDTDSGDDHDQEPNNMKPSSSQCSQSGSDRRSSWRKQCKYLVLRKSLTIILIRLELCQHRVIVNLLAHTLKSVTWLTCAEIK